MKAALVAMASYTFGEKMCDLPNIHFSRCNQPLLPNKLPMLPWSLQRLPGSSISAHGVTFLCEITTISVTAADWTSKPRKKQLKPQTYNLTSRTSSSPPAPPGLRMSSLPPQPHPASTDLATGPIPTQRSGFPKGTASSVHQRIISMSSLCDGKLLIRCSYSKLKKKKSDSRLSTQSHWPRTILQASTSPPFWKEGDSILNY